MEEQINLIKDLERKETEFMRLKRHKICVDDFELLTIIGRGAFGEVRKFIQYNSLEVDHPQWLYDFHFFFLLKAILTLLFLIYLISIMHWQSGETFLLMFPQTLGPIVSGEEIWKHLCHEEIEEI